MRLIGLDCATQDAKIGVAVGEYANGTVEVARAEACSKTLSALSLVQELLRGADDALIAIDAPLGWPVSMAMSLAHHRAGERLPAEPEQMFRRDTDRFIKKEIGKTPLDVGADRIARTAHAALRLLGDLRKATGQPVPLAWSHSLMSGISVIEVYPAATLTAHGIRATGYKKPAQTERRDAIAAQLRTKLTLPDDTSALSANGDALDAVVCLLAAKDFLDGRAMGPIDGRTASQEGWIWTARAPRP